MIESPGDPNPQLPGSPVRTAAVQSSSCSGGIVRNSHLCSPYELNFSQDLVCVISSDARDSTTGTMFGSVLGRECFCGHVVGQGWKSTAASHTQTAAGLLLHIKTDTGTEILPLSVNAGSTGLSCGGLTSCSFNLGTKRKRKCVETQQKVAVGKTDVVNNCWRPWSVKRLNHQICVMMRRRLEPSSHLHMEPREPLGFRHVLHVVFHRLSFDWSSVNSLVVKVFSQQLFPGQEWTLSTTVLSLLLLFALEKR